MITFISQDQVSFSQITRFQDVEKCIRKVFDVEHWPSYFEAKLIRLPEANDKRKTYFGISKKGNIAIKLDELSTFLLAKI